MNTEGRPIPSGVTWEVENYEVAPRSVVVLERAREDLSEIQLEPSHQRKLARENEESLIVDGLQTPILQV